MASSTTTVPIDPAEEANHLADLFNDLSQALDDFRLADHDPPLSPGDLSRLKDEAQALDDRAHYFTAEAIGETLQSIQPNLTRIKGLTAEATQQLNTLAGVSRVMSVALSVLSVGAAIAAGNPLSIASAADALAETLA